MDSIDGRYYTAESCYNGVISRYTVDAKKSIEECIESDKPRTDSFTKIGTYCLYSTEEPKSAEPEVKEETEVSLYEYFRDIDHFDNKHHLQRISGIYLSDTKELSSRASLYFGLYAKEYDKCYAEGKLTKEEYDDLNERLKNDTERCIDGMERSAALRKFWSDFYSSPPAKQDAMNRRWKMMTAEERRAELDDAVKSIISKFCKIDRNKFWDNLNAYRKM